MIQPSGHFFHIDFGYIFGRDPKPLPPAFRLTREVRHRGYIMSAAWERFAFFMFSLTDDLVFARLTHTDGGRYGRYRFQ